MLKLEDTKEIFAFVAWLDRCFYSRERFEKDLFEIVDELKPHYDKIERVALVSAFGRTYQNTGSITKVFQGYGMGEDATGSRDYEEVLFTYIDRMLVKWNSYHEKEPFKS